jgi:iron uptake system EfeUOB component EfeO/EfeM
MMALIDTHHPELPDLRAKVEGSAVLSKALEPLKDIKALVLEVELNFEPSQKMWSNLGEANFVTTWRKRPYNVEVYGISPELPVIR